MIPKLAAQLKSDSFKEARETAARALGRIGKAAPDEKGGVAPLHAASQDDADPVTRVVALGALAMLLSVRKRSARWSIRTFRRSSWPRYKRLFRIPTERSVPLLQQRLEIWVLRRFR